MKNFKPSGFFVLRTPLLPFDELVAWSDGLEAPGTLRNPGELASAIERDRERLRDRLFKTALRPEVREALFVASPQLEDAIEKWTREPISEREARMERTLVRYLVRMAGRATPFGLFAGCSVAFLADETHLVLEERAKYRRRTRLSMDYLFALTESLRSDRGLREAFSYRPNSSLYRVAGRLGYAASRLKEKDLTYHLVTLEDVDYLTATLARAEAGATFDVLAAGLIDEEVSREEATSYIHELIDSQILVAEIPLSVTGGEPLDRLIEFLRAYPGTKQMAEILGRMREELTALDAAEKEVAPARYRLGARLLEGLPVKPDLPRLFEVHLVKPAPRATLGNAVVEEIARGVEWLHRLEPTAQDDELARFQEAFVRRYEMREVPLTEALDHEVGVGFGSATDTAPLVAGLHFAEDADETLPYGTAERVLIRKLSEVLQSGAMEMAVTEDDLKEMADPKLPPLPAAFAAMATVVAASDAALAEGKFRVILDGAVGPSGARWCGRFCQADPDLQREVEKHLRAEEALRPDAIFAEIVHLPEGRSGFLCRPTLRTHEIPYLGAASVEPKNQIAVTDLFISVRQGRLVLRSKKLGREIIPRLTISHNFRYRGLGVYRFLCSLQSQGLRGDLSWNWRSLRDAPFLPRVVAGRLVLRRAQWRVDKKELKRFGELSDADLFPFIQSWRATRRLPQWVAVADSDNTLPVDLNNILSIEMFVHLVKGLDEALLVEVYPGPDELCAHGPEGKFVHEVIVPFIQAEPADAVSSQPKEEAAFSETPSFPVGEAFSTITRVFPPGSEWLYAKLYSIHIAADEILTGTIAPLVRQVLASGAADGWFFIRYSDPDAHLRLRFHGAPDRLQAEVLPALQGALRPLLDEGCLRRWQVDTYERELDRYGGPPCIALSEKFFEGDSEAILELIPLLEPGDAGLEERWRLAARGIDVLLTDLGFDLKAKASLFKNVPRGKDVRKRLRRELDEKFRQERRGLETLLDPSHDAQSPLRLGFEVWARRSRRLAPLIRELRAQVEAGRFFGSFDDFALSWVHMQVNRLMRSAQWEQELVIYDLLARHYKSLAARSVSRA